jgi:DsbC/DsbD-like thiol-disulfide interchange protein
VISHRRAIAYFQSMSQSRALVFSALLAVWAAAPMQATTQDEVLSATILPGWQMKNGHHMAAISLTLAPQWKTYWRAPGDAGIPPLFDWSGSQNVKAVRIHWPSPQVFHTNGMQTVGYHDRLVLPVEVTPLDPGQPILLRAQVDLGVCKDICMPAAVQLHAELTAPGKPDEAIRAALKARPNSGAEAGLAKIVCVLDPIADGLRLTATLTLPTRGPQEVVVFEAGNTSVWVSEAATSRQGGVLTSVAEMVESSGAPFALDRSAVKVTVLGVGRAVEITGCPAP